MNSKLVRRLSASILLVLAGCIPAMADRWDYVGRIEQALDALTTARYEEGDAGEALSRALELLPERERVAVGDQTIEVDNRRLRRILESARAETDPEKTEDLLDEAIGGLSLLVESLREGETGSESDAAARIREILARPEFRKPVEDPITAFREELKRRALEVVSNLLNRVFQAVFGGDSGGGWVLRSLIIAGALGGLGLLIWRFTRTRRRPGKPEKVTILGEEVEEGASPAQLADGAFAAAREGNFRLAIRRLYIALLYELSEKKLLDLDSHSTNREYLAKISGIPDLVSPMTFLTNRFEYAWYGKYGMSAEEFEEARSRYFEALNRAKDQSHRVKV